MNFLYSYNKRVRLVFFDNRISRYLITNRYSLFSNLLAASYSSTIAFTSYFSLTLLITTSNF